MNFRRWLPWGWLTLAALVPLGTRLIIRPGSLAGAAVEWGTISLFATQLLAVALIALTWRVVGSAAFAAALKTKPARVASWFLLAALFSTLFAADFAYALNVVVWLALGYGLLVAGIAARVGLASLAVGLVIGGLVQAVFAIVQFLTQAVPASKWLGLAAHSAATAGAFVVETADGRWLRAYGSFGHPNALGLYLALAIVVVAAFVVAARGRSRVFWLAVLPILTFGLFCSFPKSALVALVVGLAFLLKLQSKAERRGVWLASGIVVLTLGVGTILFSDLMIVRAAAQGRLETRSYVERLDATSDAAQLFLTSPLFGIGPGNMPQAIIGRIDAERSGWSAQPVHIVPLLVLVEVGLLGLVAWLSLLTLALRAALRRGNDVEAAASAVLSRCFRSASSPNILSAASVKTLLVTLLAFSLFDHFLWTVWPGQLLFWLLLVGIFAEE